MTDTTNDTLCNSYSTSQELSLLILRSTLNSVSCLCILSMIVIIILFKKYLFFTQRLILYLAISTFSFSFISVINLSAKYAHENQSAKIYCIIMGFFLQLTMWWELMAITCIMVDVFIKVVFNKFTERLEVLYFLMTFVLPLTFSWIPFIKLTYGPAGAFCWIRDRSLKGCELFYFGVYLRFSLYYIPLYLLMPIITIMTIISFCCVRRKRKQWIGQYSHEAKQISKMMEREIRPLIYYPFIFIVINIVPLVKRIYGISHSDDTASFVLALINAIVYPLLGVLITLVFALDPETRKKIKRVEIKAAIGRWCGGHKDAVSIYNIKRTHSDSFIPVSQFCSTDGIPYTKLEDD